MKSYRIMVVDDEKDMARIISKRLRINGFEVSSVNSGEEAVKSLKEKSYDLVVLDLIMPGLDGYGVLREMQRIKNKKKIPVIALTAKLSQEDKVKALDMGVDDYLTKPYDPEELIARIKAVLRRTESGEVKKIENILITGGAGFIGSALARAFLKKKYQVTVIDDFSTGRRINIKDMEKNEKFRLITGSVTDETLVSKAIEECDIVYHLAATVGVKKVVDNPLETIISDTIGTATVLEYASACGVKVILTSTSEVYGKSEKLPFKESDDLVMGPPNVNRWSYACSKLLDEFFAIGYCKERGLPVVVVRLFNVVGPGQVGSYGMVIPRFFSRALKNEPISVYGDGTQVRCFTYIDDVVDIIIRLADMEEANGSIINVGSKNAISIKALALEIKRLTKSSSEIIFEPYQKYYGSNFQDIKKRVPDLTKLKKITGIVPEITLEEILKRMYSYYKKNPGELSAT